MRWQRTCLFFLNGRVKFSEFHFSLNSSATTLPLALHKKKERMLVLFPAVSLQKQNKRYAWKTFKYPTFLRTWKYLEIAYGEDGNLSFG